MIVDVDSDVKIYCLGDLHEHDEALDLAIEHIKPDPKNILVSVGDLYDKGWGHKSAEKMADIFKDLVKKRSGYIIRGNHELKHIRRAKQNEVELSPQLKWLSVQPLALSFRFSNGSKLTVVHGGVTPKHKLEDLDKTVDTCYVRTIDERGKSIRLIRKKDDEGNITFVPKKEGKVWHEYYDGRFGYIISGHHAQKDGIPKFYNYSCNLDSAVYHTGKLSVQEFTKDGRGELLTFTCQPKYPDLKEMWAAIARRRI